MYFHYKINVFLVVENYSRHVWNHVPQVTHSVLGMETLRFFLFSVCGIIADWKLEDVLEEQIQKIKQMVGPEIMASVHCQVVWTPQLQQLLYTKHWETSFTVLLWTMDF